MKIITLQHMPQLVRRHTDSFKYTPSRGWKRIQRLCIWILRRLGCEYVEEQRVSCWSAVANESSIRELLNKHLREIYGYGNYRDGKLIMGRDAAGRVWGEMVARSPFSVHANEMFRDGRIRQYMGIDIVVVPWIEGCFFIPNELLEAKK